METIFNFFPIVASISQPRTLGSGKIINCEDCCLSIATYNYQTVKWMKNKERDLVTLTHEWLSSEGSQ